MSTEQLEEIEGVHAKDIAEEEKRKIEREQYKSLTKYQVSKSFKELQEHLNVAMESLLEDIRAEMDSRDGSVVKWSGMKERTIYKLSIEAIIDKVTCKEYKEYLLERADKYQSYVDNHVGDDEPIYTDCDLIKFNRQEYYNICNHYLEFAIERVNPKVEKDEDNSVY